jgi:hypothetical protein
MRCLPWRCGQEGNNLKNGERKMEENKTERVISEDLKKALISYIMDLSPEERKELLAMWKGRHQE